MHPLAASLYAQLLAMQPEGDIHESERIRAARDRAAARVIGACKTWPHSRRRWNSPRHWIAKRCARALVGPQAEARLLTSY